MTGCAGTAEDPFDGSTSAKFDTVMASLTANTTIHLGPGTFKTVVAPSKSWKVLSGWKIISCGMYVTTIQADTSGFGGVTGEVDVINSDSNGQVNGFYISDLTVDCNLPNIAPNVADTTNGQRTFADGVTTSGSATLKSATASFRWGDLFKGISGSGIPASTTVVRIPATTTGASSDGVAMSGTYTVNTATNGTTDFAATGTILVESTVTRFNVITYTGKTASSFTGCTGGSGSMFTDGNITTDSQLVMSANATITASSVSVTLAGEKNLKVMAVAILGGTNITMERVRSINTFGSKANSQECFPFFIRNGQVAGTLDGTNNHYRFCIAESPYGNYSDGFSMAGNSANHPVTNSSIEYSVVRGINDGYGDLTNHGGSGFNNYAFGIGHSKDCQILYNTSVDASVMNYCDTGSQKNLQVIGNTAIRCATGSLYTQGAGAINDRISLIGNFLQLQNRSEGGAQGNGFYSDAGATNSNYKVQGNTVVSLTTGRGSLTGGFPLLIRNVAGLIVQGNTFDNWSGRQYDFTGTTSKSFSSNKNTDGSFITELSEGTSTNDNATAGNPGEYVTATLATGSSITLTTNTAANVTSISLTAGDWDVTGAVDFIFGATTSYTNLVGSISTTSATIGAQDSLFDFETPAAVPTAGADCTFAVPTVRVSIASTTTVYLVAKGTFTVSSLKSYGTIRARRIR